MAGKNNLRAAERTKHGAQKEFLFCTKWIGALSNKGDLVVDPFVGTGTTIAAAAHLGREFFGCDIQEKWANFTAKRAQLALQSKDTRLKRNSGNKTAFFSDQNEV